MNLELLLSKEQLPDRVDATLSLPSIFHFKKKLTRSQESSGTWGVANCVAFNRRGTYAAVGYESGTVAVFDVLSRTLCAVYKTDSVPDDHTPSSVEDGTPSDAAPRNRHGVSFLSWSKRSRSLIVGTAGECEVRLIDTTHPFGPEECSVIARKDDKEKIEESSKGDEENPPESTAEKKRKRKRSPLFTEPLTVHQRSNRNLTTKLLKSTEAILPKPEKRTAHHSHQSAELSKMPRYPIMNIKFPKGVRSLQIHPKDTSAGIVALDDGSLAAFWVPVDAWEVRPKREPDMHLAVLFKSDDFFVTCASFDPDGDKIYAGTASGKLLGFEAAMVFNRLAAGASEIPAIKPNFVIHVPGGASVSQIVVSRSGKTLILNSTDAAIRLYSTKECWTTPEEVEKPVWVFQDTTSKIKFCSCDFSGDGEIVLGGANGGEKEYGLYLWSASTGELLDKLSGAPLDLNCVACHPTRSFLAVAASDGLVDIWGPRVNWTAFAPNFEALTANIEYIECEDEFDIADDGDHRGKIQAKPLDEDDEVDVLAVHQIADFASDSEDEGEVFSFETKVKAIFGLYTN